MDCAIGGFLPLERNERGAGAFALWGIAEDNAWRFANARSALAHLLRRCEAQRLLMPAYICPELAAAAGGKTTLRFYPIDEDFSPDLGALKRLLRPGDCVLAVDYFGRKPDGAFLDVVAEHDGPLWVEDRAQALFPASRPWAPWVLYSPRKLFGVPDGGILHRVGATVAPVAYGKRVKEDRAAPRRPRGNDGDARDAAARYEAYRDVEARMSVSDEPMSDMTRELLSTVDAARAIARRRANYAALATELPDHALLGGPSVEFAPFGFPVRVRDAAATQSALAARRIFAARYWPELPSDPDAFPVAHVLAREVLVLPCDQRYDRQAMRRVAAAFREVGG